MKVPIPEQILPAASLGTVHFIGIGGAGLSAIARIMLQRGIAVQGSDGKESPVLDQLRELGARVWVGHRAEQVDGADSVVVSTAVAEDNPEVVEATRRGLRLIPRSAGLQSVICDRRVVAVAGTHGKTTTTSLLTMALLQAGADPSYAVGGEIAQLGTNAHHGGGEVVVAEADESDGAFLVYTPFGAIVTNVEADHLDNWGTEEAYHAAFAEFVGRIDPSGFVVCCADDPGAAAVAREARERGLRTITVGEAPDADLRAVDLRFEGTRSEFTVRRGDEDLGRVVLQIPGRHYVLDALAALAAGLELGHDLEPLAAGLASFTGTRRRMERKGEAAGVRVYDSYAHHPQEIAGDLQAARTVAGEGRLVVAYQPHLVSRTRIFGEQMGRELSAADEVIVTDVYLAREPADPDVTGALVARAVELPADRVHVVPALADVATALADAVRPGDLALTLGAGDITEVGPRLLEVLGARE